MTAGVDRKPHRCPAVTEEQLERIFDLRERGLSMLQIERLVGVKKETAYWHCIKHGIEPLQGRRGAKRAKVSPSFVRDGHVVRGFTAEEDALLLELRKQGKSVPQIRKILGRPQSSVYGRLYLLARHEGLEA